MANISERVDNGIHALNKHNPDWRNKVDCAILDLYSHRDCVLGQVYESYYVGTLALKLTEENVVELGFDAKNPADKKEYEKLTEEWKRRILGVILNGEV